MRFSRLQDWLSWQEGLHPNAIDLGLDRLYRTITRLQWRKPACPVVTVAGTNGKGSSVALLSSILAAAGHRVGAFTSPHLIRYNERIHIGGQQVSDAALIDAFERIDAARADDTLTFFEFNTLAALLVFEASDLDAIVLEVGMGGRLDAVNVVDPDIALVTSIALDHCDWLGADVETIALEKAGIFRSGKPAIFGSREMPLAIETHARVIGSRLMRLDLDYGFERNADDVWSWFGVGMEPIDALPRPALFGDAQYDNASAVLQVIACMQERLPTSREAIERGLRSVRLPGRYQVISREGVEWVLDVAHNPAAAKTLAHQLRIAPGRRNIAVCGILGDKDIEGIVRELKPNFCEWIVAGVEGSRALDPLVLAERLRIEGANVMATGASVAKACEIARARAVAGDRIVVFGSFLTVGPALEWLQPSAD